MFSLRSISPGDTSNLFLSCKILKKKKERKRKKIIICPKTILLDNLENVPWSFFSLILICAQKLILSLEPLLLDLALT